MFFTPALFGLLESDKLLYFEKYLVLNFIFSANGRIKDEDFIDNCYHTRDKICYQFTIQMLINR